MTKGSRKQRTAIISVVAVVVFAIVLVGVAALQIHPEEARLSQVDTSVTGEGQTDAATQALSRPDPLAVATSLDAASGTQDINIFQSSGTQRTLASSELPEVTAALSAFHDAEYDAGFVLYDFATERGLGCNADGTFFAASTVKAPFVSFVLQALVDQGYAALDDEIEKDIVMEGTGIMAEDDSESYDLGTVLFNTIAYSDNTGYALLREHYEDAGFEDWAASVGVDVSVWEGEWFPYCSPRDMGKLWLNMGAYFLSGSSNAAYCESLFAQSEASFMRRVLSPQHIVYSKPGYEIDTPFYDMGALNDAGIVSSDKGDYLMVIMSDADYDDEYFTENEPLIMDLITALDVAHDNLLAK